MKLHSLSRTTLPRLLGVIQAVFAIGIELFSAESHAAQPGSAVADQILVRRKSHLSEQAAQTLFAVHGAKEVDSIPQIDVRVLQVPAAARDKVLAALQNNPNIEFAELNGIAQISATTNDPEVLNGRLWHLVKIQAAQAWDVTAGNASTIVAIVDTGVSPNHPDLAGKLLAGYNFYANNSNWADDHGHGTQAAGVAAAQGNNGIGVAGVAWNTVILPVKISNSSASSTYSILAQGINYAADRGARVINVSYGGTTASSTLQNAVNYAWSKNAVIVASAGNSGTSTPEYPGACTHVIAVAALQSNDTRASWSNYGNHVDITAPGSMIYTTFLDGSYNYVSGTSFSSPMVAGVATLVAAAKPTLTNAAIVDILLANADDLGTAGYDIYNGYGRVNAFRSVSATGAPPPPDVTVPLSSITTPSASSTVSGVVNVSVSATDNVGVTKVDLYLDGVLGNSSTQAPTSFSWDTTTSSNGTHALCVRAYDAAGNVGTSADVPVMVQNLAPDTTPPTAWITSPTANAVVSKTTKVYVGTSDDRGVVRVELYADGAFLTSSTSPSPIFSWNTAKVSSGTHTLKAVAFDAAGNAGASAQVSVRK